MGTVKLFAWARPVVGAVYSPDHTWVTTYDNRIDQYATIEDVRAADEQFWYCWGDFHSQGGTHAIQDGFLAAGGASLPYAACLCMPDVPSKAHPLARGTIFTYALDGVCHQLANQVLWATDPTGKAPATVNKADGYRISEFFFGTYGVQHTAWAQKKVSCSTSRRLEMNMRQAEAPDDRFEEHLHEVLTGPDAEAKIAQLLDFRREMMEHMAKIREHAFLSRQMPNVEMLNDMYSTFLGQASAILGKQDYEKVFGQTPDKKTNVVDPEVYRTAPPLFPVI